MQRGDQQLPSLLLLPAPPAPATRESVAAAYGPPLDAAVARAGDAAGPAVLVVALACPGLLAGRFRHARRLADWAAAQSLAARVYALASAACARRAIRAHAGAGPGSVDVRVVLVDHDRHHHGGSGVNGAATAAVAGGGGKDAGVEPNNTAVVDLATFAAAYHPWHTIFYCSTEAGLGVFSEYLRLAEGRQALRQDQLVAVDGGLTMNVSAAAAAAAAVPTEEADSSSGPSPPPKGHHYRTVCIGGTFDHLHAGHKLLLTGGALLLDMPRVEEGLPAPDPAPARFIVGVTGDELLRNKQHADLVEPWDRRAKGIIDFLSTLLELQPTGWKGKGGGDGQEGQQGAGSGCYKIAEADGDFRASFRDGAVSVECVRIQDAFGPTIVMPELESLVVSAETRSGGQAVNDKRAELGWAPLQIFEVDVLDAGSGEDNDGKQPTPTSGFASKISSTAIRKALSESQP
ncbi:hypothetical protein RB595_003148 [Gaeumannomyces hyphopodioides]